MGAIVPKRRSQASKNCRKCGQLKPGVKAKKRRQRLQSDHGLGPQEYALLLQVQTGLCAICRQPEVGRRLAVDHCHATGRIRGLLCSRCNTALGLLDDSGDRLRKAADYIG